MKLKVFSTLGVVAALVLPFGITSASAETATTVDSPTQSDVIVASPDAVIVQGSPVVTTIAAPVPDPVVETVAPATVTAVPDTTVVESAPVAVPTPVATVASEPVTAPAAPTTATTQAAPTPVVAAQAVVQAPAVIAENPLCTQQYLFTVTAAGDCSAAPVGYTVAQLREDAKFELNSRNPLATADPSTLAAFEADYLGSGPAVKPGVHIIHSASIPGVVYYFSANH